MSKLTIQSVSIENFGPFRERQHLDMSVSERKPVILIQALNGSGKTTLLMAIQLALYGQAATNASRKSAYEALIESLRRNDVSENPVVEVALIVETAGEKVPATLRREWGKVGAKFVEKFSVFRNGLLDVDLTSNWGPFIEDILPIELAQLFLFDGEKIEALANPQRLPDLLRSATEAFLGVGSIDGLINDLQAIERRTMLRSKEGGLAYEQLKTELPVLEEKVKTFQVDLEMLAQQRASTRSDLDRVQMELERFTAGAKRQGLGAFDAAAELRGNVAFTTERKKRAAEDLASALSHPLVPVAKVMGLLHGVLSHVEDQLQAEAQVRLAKQIGTRDRRVLNILERHLTPAAHRKVVAILDEDRESYVKFRAPRPLFVSDPDMSNMEGQIVEAATEAKRCRLKLNDCIRALEAAEAKMAEIPEGEQLGGVLAALQHKTQAVASCEERLKVCELSVEARKVNLTHAETRLNSVRKRLLTDFKDVGISGKSLEAAARAKKAFEKLKIRMLASKAALLSRQITIEFKALIRKQGFVERIEVDPVSYGVTMVDGSGDELSMERLSAGERQLLAIAVLSALIKERKSSFPVIVDTPLARLDRHHREAMVKNFFSTVSHQVMVLSTDQEVSGRVYEALHPYTNQEIELHFDEEKRRTLVMPLIKIENVRVAA